MEYEQSGTLQVRESPLADSISLKNQRHREMSKVKKDSLNQRHREMSKVCRKRFLILRNCPKPEDALIDDAQAKQSRKVETLRRHQMGHFWTPPDLEWDLEGG